MWAKTMSQSTDASNQCWVNTFEISEFMNVDSAFPQDVGMNAFASECDMHIPSSFCLFDGEHGKLTLGSASFERRDQVQDCWHEVMGRVAGLRKSRSVPNTSMMSKAGNTICTTLPRGWNVVSRTDWYTKTRRYRYTGRDHHLAC